MNRAGYVEDTRVADLRLEVGAKFWYWFDFGDDWYHEITVIDIGEPEPKTRYPKVVDRAGKSPPQYPDIDWDEDWEDEESDS